MTLITVTQETLGSREVSILLTPEGSAAGFSQQAKIFRDQAQVIKDACLALQSSLQPLLDNLAKLQNVEGSLDEIEALEAKLTELTAIHNKLSVLQALYDDLAEFNALYASLSELLAVHTNLGKITNVEAALASIAVVEAKLTELQAVYAKLAEIETVADNIVALAAIHTELAKLTELHSNLAKLTTVYNNLSAIGEVADSIANLNQLAASLTNLNTLAASLTNLNALAGSLDELNTLHSNLSALLTVEDNLTAINAVNDALTNINTAATNIAAINTAASNIAAIIAAPTHATTATNAAAAAVVTKGQVEDLKGDVQTLKSETNTLKLAAETAETNAAESEDNAAASAAQAETLANSISLGGVFWPETEALRTRVIANEGTFIQPMRIIDPQMDDVQGVNTPLLTNMAAYKTGKLYSIRPDDASGDFTCVRATTPTRINQLGESEVVPVNTPVIDWSTGSPLLIVTVEGELTLTTPTSATKIVITIDGEDVEYNNVFPTLSLPVGSITKVIATVGGTEYDLLKAYLLRVDTASGTINEQGARDLKTMYEFLDDEGLLSGLELLYLSNAGIVQRTDGVLKYVRTAFDASDNDNDLDGSATASQQPRLVGGIAPNSKPAASNQNGEGRYFTHPAISFGASDAWSVTFMINMDGNEQPIITFTALTDASNDCAIFLKLTNYIFGFRSSNNVTTQVNAKDFIGKYAIGTVTHNGSGGIGLYINGMLKNVITNTTNAGSALFKNIIGNYTSNRSFTGKFKAYHLQSQALTATQVTNLHTTLRGLYPEIESTTIGTQTWASRNFEAVATPLGNVIANVTDNTAWANATVLYDAAYTAHVGDAAAKEYAGLKAAAMWCYYNNSADNGAIYGKLYNWYAAKLLDLDMVTAGFGWRLPTSAQFTTLATYLGGTSVAGGKMKMTGLDYWNTPNTGATNESGFTALGVGYRWSEGSFFTSIKKYALMGAINNLSINRTTYEFSYDSAAVTIFSTRDVRIGTALRLIKA